MSDAPFATASLYRDYIGSRPLPRSACRQVGRVEAPAVRRRSIFSSSGPQRAPRSGWRASTNHSPNSRFSMIPLHSWTVAGSMRRGTDAGHGRPPRSRSGCVQVGNSRSARPSASVPRSTSASSRRRRMAQRKRCAAAISHAITRLPLEHVHTGRRANGRLLTESTDPLPSIPQPKCTKRLKIETSPQMRSGARLKLERNRQPRLPAIP
jgi:hypothetical protein